MCADGRFLLSRTTSFTRQSRPPCGHGEFCRFRGSAALSVSVIMVHGRVRAARCMLAASMMMLGCAFSVAATLRQTGSSLNAVQVSAASSWRLSHLLYLVPICFTPSLGGTFRKRLGWTVPYRRIRARHRCRRSTDRGEHIGVATSLALPFVVLKWHAWSDTRDRQPMSSASKSGSSRPLTGIKRVCGIRRVGSALRRGQHSSGGDDRGSGIAPGSNERHRTWRAQHARLSWRVGFIRHLWRARRTSSQRRLDVWPDLRNNGDGPGNRAWNLRDLSSEGCGAKGDALVGLKATFRLPPTLVDAGATGSDTR